MVGSFTFAAAVDEANALLDDRVPKATTLERDEAVAELTKRYFTSHGPALAQAFAWWSGLAMADAKAGIEMTRPHLLHEVIGDKTYLDRL